MASEFLINVTRVFAHAVHTAIIAIMEETILRLHNCSNAQQHASDFRMLIVNGFESVIN